MDPSKPLEIRGMVVKCACNMITYYVGNDSLLKALQELLPQLIKTTADYSQVVIACSKSDVMSWIVCVQITLNDID